MQTDCKQSNMYFAKMKDIKKTFVWKKCPRKFNYHEIWESKQNTYKFTNFKKTTTTLLFY